MKQTKIKTKHSRQLREAAKKVLLLVAGPIRGGGGLTGVPLRKFFFFNVRKKVPMTTKQRGRAKGLSGRAIKKRTFFTQERNFHY